MANVVRKVDIKTEQEIKKIIERITSKLGLPEECVMGRYGSEDCSDARFIIVKVIKDRFDWVTDIYIGKLFNRNNHLFAFNAELKCKELIMVNKRFKEKYNKVVDAKITK